MNQKSQDIHDSWRILSFLWRRLYGYAQKVGTKRYESRGLVSALGGKKIEKSLILIPMGNRGEIIKYLNREKIGYDV